MDEEGKVEVPGKEMFEWNAWVSSKGQNNEGD